MLIPTEIVSAAKHIGEEKAIELYAKAGFDAWDFPAHLMLPYDWDAMQFTETNHLLAGKDYLKCAKKLKKSAKTMVYTATNPTHLPPLPSIY